MLLQQSLVIYHKLDWGAEVALDGADATTSASALYLPHDFVSWLYQLGDSSTGCIITTNGDRNLVSSKEGQGVMNAEVLKEGGPQPQEYRGDDMQQNQQQQFRYIPGAFGLAECVKMCRALLSCRTETDRRLATTVQ